MTAGWVEALKRYEVNVGVSIDGRRADHDRFRVDHQGRSSFDATEATIECLVKESDRYPWLRPSTISVLHRDADYRGTYSYLRGLGVRSMHFLLPDRNADASISEDEAAALGRGLLAVFEAWLTEDDPDINIRFISEMLGHLQIGRSQAPLRRHRKHNQIIVARSDATIAIDDSLIPALGWYREAQAFPIARHTLRDVLGDPIFGMLDAERSRLPEGCQGCQWTQVCGGGDLENRYSAARAFNNPSVYCDTYKTLYQGICRTLVENGYPPSELALRFGVPEFA
jgi:uncharacterized protein